MNKPKTLSERVSERMLKKKPTRGAQNRATFLALRQDIKQTLDDGWPVKSIWETLNEEGKITFSYQAFCGYVNRLILTSTKIVASDQGQRPSEQASTKTITKPTTNTGFTFNPEPNEEELF